MRNRRPTYLSFINFFVFCVLFASLWLFAFDLKTVEAIGLSRTHLEMLMLQSISFLLVVCAVQLPAKGAAVWRATLLGFSFVALAESSLVALLSPIG